MGDPREARALFSWASRELTRERIKVISPRDLRTGVVLIRLIEHLTGEHISPALYDSDPTDNSAMLSNNQCALDFLKTHGLEPRGVQARAIFDGSLPAIITILSLLYFSFQAKTPHITGTQSGDALLQWVQILLRPQGLSVVNWTTSWSDGTPFYLLVTRIAPPLPQRGQTPPKMFASDRERRSLEICRSLNIPVYASPGDIVAPRPAGICIKMQVQELYNGPGSRTVAPLPPSMSKSFPNTMTLPILPPIVDKPMIDFSQSAPAPILLKRRGRRRAPRSAPSANRPMTDLPIPIVAEHLPPDCSGRFALGIDFGASAVRYGLIARGSTEPEVTVFDRQMCLTADGKLVLGRPSPELVPFPSVYELIGRPFREVEGGFPFRMFAHEVSHTCVIEVGGVRVTPEGIVSKILGEVRAQASEKAKEPVVDATIAVPAAFSVAQREALRNAAEGAGLRVAHMAAGPLLAARALRSAGEVAGSGLIVVVDCGASKTDVSLIESTPDGLRECRTCGSGQVSMDRVCSAVASLYLSEIRAETPDISPRDIAALQEAVRVAVCGDHCVKLAGYGGGKQFEKEITELEFEVIGGPVADRLKQLCESVVINDDVKSNIRRVGCVGGATRFKAFEAAVRSALPDVELSDHVDDTVARGATLDAGELTKRLPEGACVEVTAAAPDSLGTGV
jgi:molecular chaperone DnaK